MGRLSLLFTLFLLGCTSLVPSAAGWLGGVDPLTADPSEISVAIELSDGLGVLPETVKLALSAQHPDRGTIEDIWVLETAQAPDQTWFFRVAEQDRAEMRRVQRMAREWELADPDGTTGSISVALGGCRTVSYAQLTDARASVYIRLSDDGSFRPLFRNAPISEILNEAQMPELPMCP